MAGIFGAISLLFAGWVASVAFLLTRLFHGGQPTGLLVWVIALLLVFLLPLLAVSAISHAFRRFALPLANLMSAADAVGRGDLTVRVPVFGLGGLARLADSFNHMVAELERADRQRRNLTADVAHELRTPLHVIQGNLEGILDGVYEPNAENIEATLGETRLLARLVEDLRTLSLAEAGQLPLQHERIDAGELLADVTTSFSGQAEAAGIHLQASTTGDDGELTVGVTRNGWTRCSATCWPTPCAIPRRVGRSLCRQRPAEGRAAAADGERASVQRARRAHPRRRHRRGHPPADLPFIFDRFWRGDRSRSHAQGAGSGLGLAIARQLVQAHGGRIRVESQPGQGTTLHYRSAGLRARPFCAG